MHTLHSRCTPNAHQPDRPDPLTRYISPRYTPRTIPSPLSCRIPEPPLLSVSPRPKPLLPPPVKHRCPPPSRVSRLCQHPHPCTPLPGSCRPGYLRLRLTNSFLPELPSLSPSSTITGPLDVLPAAGFLSSGLQSACSTEAIKLLVTGPCRLPALPPRDAFTPATPAATSPLCRPPRPASPPSAASFEHHRRPGPALLLRGRPCPRLLEPPRVLMPEGQDSCSYEVTVHTPINVCSLLFRRYPLHHQGYDLGSSKFSTGIQWRYQVQDLHDYGTQKYAFDNL